MTTQSGDRSAVQLVPQERRAEALSLVFRRLAEPGRDQLVASLLAEAERSRLSLDGLLEARHGKRLVGAVWAQLQPGGTVDIWPPEIAPDQMELLATELLQAAVKLSTVWPVRMAQALLETDGTAQAARFLQAGFQHTTDLLYLVSEATAFPTTPPADEMRFDAYEHSDHERLAQVVRRTYERTKDCPSLNGVRDVDDVLTGYRAIGVFDPARWLIARHHGRDVGCLLLADHPSNKQWELVYMGVVPEARGRGWGLDMTRHAQWLAREADRNRVVLAVDAANSPALAVYAAAGFKAFDRRSVFLRVFDEPDVAAAD